ncbi:MAG: hypothetical protein QW680_13205 [Pyrobaculum sp.]|uniref:hypothetical protein n=1 Tax=Pyrobaculum sp. TaxID=2004705 RepID=UPI00316253EE
MGLKRKSLSEVLGNNEEEAVPVITTPQMAQPTAASQPAVITTPQPTQPVATAQAGWQYHLAAAITQMPEEMAAKLLNCLPKEAVIEMLKSRSNDPLMKLALLLLQRNV